VTAYIAAAVSSSTIDRHAGELIVFMHVEEGRGRRCCVVVVFIQYHAKKINIRPRAQPQLRRAEPEEQRAARNDRGMTGVTIFQRLHVSPTMV